MAQVHIKTNRTCTPKCYAYTTPQIAENNGWIKIGYTEQDVHTRIRQQTQTAGIKYTLEWQGKAQYNDGKFFHDTDFHRYLKHLNIERKPASEWFKVGAEESQYYFEEFKKTRGEDSQSSGVIPYTLRDEQKRAVEQTKAYFESHYDKDLDDDPCSGEPKFLWNAKPRFGKTLSAYDLCKALNAKKVLIVTNRPAIATSWYSDYMQFLGKEESGYYFISTTSAVENKLNVYTHDKLNVYTHDELPHEATKIIEFVSLQDMKGSMYFGGKYDKLKELATTFWDLLIIDEAHEGVDTSKTDTAFNHVQRKYTLHLSGTPFKALAKGDFEADAIFSWTYADEQKAKRDWDYTRGENPYESLPTLNLFTYKMSDIIENKARQGADFNNDGNNEAYAFDLNEFFSTNSKGEFKYDSDVDKFLDALTQQTRFPFSTEELRNELKHTFWLLNRVESAKALIKKLQVHPVFKDYKIVSVAGDGKIENDELNPNTVSDDDNKRSVDKVKEAIKEHDKTITVSVGQLTTGITIPEWTAVLMLSNMKSPALYMQAAFRSQNPWKYSIDGEYYCKENAYVFDFDPARTLEIFEQFANDLSTDTSRGGGDIGTRKQHIMELLNFFPVYGEDEDGEMTALDAEEVLSIPRKIHAFEVFKRGFMSNFLFQNISNIFNAPQNVIDIINKIEPQKEPVTITPQTKNDLNLDENGNVVIPNETAVGISKGIFGDKIYGTPKGQEDTPTSNTPPTKISPVEEAKKNFTEHVVKPVINTAKEHYGRNMTKSTENRATRDITNKANRKIENTFANHDIKQKALAHEKEKEIAEATKQGIDTNLIEDKYNQLQKEENSQFKTILDQTVEQLTEEAEKTVVQMVETEKKEKEKKELEEPFRDHLRGFCRTIPSFLMAYGTKETTLENFDTSIPDNVFKEVTSITLDEFNQIKPYINSTVFNDAVLVFLDQKEKLSDYFDETQQEDIFDYIPPQKTNQIFTPKKVVKEMVRNLEQECPECFNDPNKTFIDLYMKSGLYITEIVKKLFNSPALKEAYPNENDRLNHIFAHQVYGLAPTEIIYKIALSYILGFSKKDNFHIEKHNLRHFDTLPSVQKGTLEQDLDRLFE